MSASTCPISAPRSDGGAAAAAGDQLARISQAVCRVEVGTGSVATGMGFVVGRGVLLTNHRHIGTSEACENARAVFLLDGQEVKVPLDPSQIFVTSPCHDDEGVVDKEHLDYTVVGLKEDLRLEDVFAHPVTLALWHEARPNNAYVIGHPVRGGRRGALGPGSTVTWGPWNMQYTSDAVGGSPVVGMQRGVLKLFALHKSGSSGAGIGVKAIIADLLHQVGHRPLLAWVPMDADSMLRLSRFFDRHGYYVWDRANAIYLAHRDVMEKDPANHGRARELLHRAADLGHAAAEFALAQRYFREAHDGVHIRIRTLQSGIDYLRKSASKGRYEAVVMATNLPDDFSQEEIDNFWEAAEEDGTDVNSLDNRMIRWRGRLMRAIT